MCFFPSTFCTQNPQKTHSHELIQPNKSGTNSAMPLLQRRRWRHFDNVVRINAGINACHKNSRSSSSSKQQFVFLERCDRRHTGEIVKESGVGGAGDCFECVCCKRVCAMMQCVFSYATRIEVIRVPYDYYNYYCKPMPMHMFIKNQKTPTQKLTSEEKKQLELQKSHDFTGRRPKKPNTRPRCFFT